MTSKWATLLAGAVIVLAALTAYHNSFSAPFIFDDQSSILDNRTIRHLWPIWSALSPPPTGGVGGRPIINLSLAVNYAIGGTDVRGYHATNVTIHILAGLTLFGIVRRTLQQPGLSGRFGAVADLLALVTALIWVVHPLQTESVTCVIQRSESLMGLFYLLTLYCFIRGAMSRAPSTFAKASADKGIWYGLSVTACLLGMASKEVMVSAPLMALLYDRTFVSGSFREAWSRRWRLHLALATTWILLGYLVVVAGTESGTRGFGINVGWWEYALTQFRAIVHYLYLSIWPHPLVLDYGAGLARHAAEVVPYAIIIILLLVGTALALWRWPAIGFVGAWFFAILAPSSSIVPLATQTVAEHRMYLPLAAVVVILVIGMFLLGKTLLRGRQKLGRALGWGLGGAAVLLIAVLTIRRNFDYASPLAIWQDTVNKCPGNHRAHYNWGVALFQAGRIEDAIERYKVALQLNPEFADAYDGMGVALFEAGRVEEAIRYYEQALRKKPDLAWAHNNLGAALLQTGKTEDAVRHLEQAVGIMPDWAEAHNNLGNALVKAGRVEEALGHYEQAVRLEPDRADAHYNLGVALFNAGRVEEAVGHYEQVVRLNPDHADANNNLAWILATDDDERLRDPARAVQLAGHACELTKRRDPGNLDTLAATQAAAGRFDDAIRTAQEAINVALAAGQKDLAREIQDHLELYKAGQPFRRKPAGQT